MKGLYLFLTLFLVTNGQELEEDFTVEEFKTEEQMEETFEINQRGAIYDSVTGKRRYDNYQLIRVDPQTDEHLDVLQFLDRGSNYFFNFPKLGSNGK